MNFKANEKDALLKKIALQTSGDVILTDEKEREAARQLHSDGYIRHTRSDSGQTLCQISPVGKVFLECGGYCGKEKQNLKTSRKGLWIPWWMEVLKGLILVVAGYVLRLIFEA